MRRKEKGIELEDNGGFLNLQILDLFMQYLIRFLDDYSISTASLPDTPQV